MTALRSVPLVANDKMVASDTLENIVRAANIAGYMEKEERIVVPDDTQLMTSLVDGYNTWFNLEDPVSWDEIIEDKLLKDFGPELVYVLISKVHQGAFSDHFGEEPEPAVTLLGAYSSRISAVKEKNRLDEVASIRAKTASDEDLDLIHNTSYEVVEMVMGAEVKDN